MTLAAILAFITRYWRAILLTIAGLIVLLFLWSFCGTREPTKKEQEIQANKIITEHEIKGLENSKVNINGEVINAANDSNGKMENVNRARNANIRGTNARDLEEQGNELYP